MNNPSNVYASDMSKDKPVLTLVDADVPSQTETDDHIDPNEIPPSTSSAQPSEFVYLDSLAVAALDRFSLVRVFRDQWRRRVEFHRSDEGGNLPLEEAIEAATHKVDEPEALETFERLLTQPAENISFRSLLDMWSFSPADAEFVFQEMKREAQREFQSGHLATTVFEPVEWMRSAWQRAKFLAVRDTFIDEYEPEGGVEVALIDNMAQAYFLQLHWTTQAVRRTITSPRRLNEEYCELQKFKRESHESARMWDPGNWELSLATELEHQEQAVKLADNFSKLFLRSVRMLDSHRLSKAKLRRLSLPKVRRPADDKLNDEIDEKADRLDQVRRARATCVK